MGCLSFFANKNLVTGEGGMLVTRNRGWAERSRTIRSHGMKALSWDKYRGHLSSYDIEKLGYNYRITEIQSALGLVQLRKLDRNNQRRRRLVEVYREELQGVEGISIPFSQFEGNPSYHLFPILVIRNDTRSALQRDQLVEGLRHFGIQTSIHYPPVHLFSLYRRGFGYQKGMFPRTEEVSQREVTLPLHPRMKAQDVKWIVDKIKEVIKTKNQR
jgi:dTDP-4-amino-4,6-dideoxygalactose transaminase